MASSNRGGAGHRIDGSPVAVANLCQFVVSYYFLFSLFEIIELSSRANRRVSGTTDRDTNESQMQPHRVLENGLQSAHQVIPEPN
jgi:hypothetical protein